MQEEPLPLIYIGEEGTGQTIFLRYKSLGLLRLEENSTLEQASWSQEKVGATIRLFIVINYRLFPHDSMPDA